MSATTVASNAHWLFRPLKLEWSGKILKIPFFNVHLHEEVKYGGITLKIAEPYDTYKFRQACAAEFIAMMFFVCMCCGCAMVTLNLPNPNLMMVAASFGFGIMCLAQFVGPLSGGHINCAVSWGLFVAGRVSLVRVLCYTFSQMAGSIMGALFLWTIFGSNWPAARAFGSNSWDITVFTGGQVFLAEMCGTMILLYNVFATIDSPTVGGGRLGNYPIAMSVMVAHLFLIPIDGCSINPTRSFGPALVAGLAGIKGTVSQPYPTQQYMFWFAPLIGATITAIIYEYAPLKQKKREGKGNMQDDLYLAKVKRGELDDVEIDDEPELLKSNNSKSDQRFETD